MEFARNITRLPRAFDPELGQDCLDRLPGLSGDTALLVKGAAGSSPYLKDLMLRQSAWLEEALCDADASMDALFRDLAALREDLPKPDALRPVLREAKQRVAMIAALADLAGIWPLERVTGVLSDFAALACDIALKAEIAQLVRRGKLPGQGEADVAEAAGLVVLAMGKMGAGELNYSSDIDLICLFDETRYDPDDFHEARQSLVRATRNMCATLSERTGDGYVFRTDLRLRPDPSVTPVCMSMAAAETYYESLGRTWERAAYIKANPVAGDIAAGARFIKTLRPFVWRRHLDFAAIQDAHDMRLRIRQSKGLGGAVTVPGHDMKLGRGGIREIEFFTQTRQLIAGGRDESLRQRGTVAGLQALAARDWLPGDISTRLIGYYRAHREVEHRIQMVHDAQTHKVPVNPEELARVACLMDRDSVTLTSELSERLNAVHELTEGFFAPEAGGAAHEDPPPEIDMSICRRWPSYPALRSERARQIFERLRPELLTRLSRTTEPQEALLALDGFLAGLPAGVQLFSLFEANPQLIDLLVDIVGTSPALAGYLARNASVFDAVIGGDFFADWPGEPVLSAGAEAALAREPDYESKLDAARRWAKEWRFRIGVHHLRGLIGAQEAGQQYADLADSVIKALFPVVVAQFAAKHGAPPGRGAAVIGMGSLGARALNAVSDLDLIVIYDPEDQDYSDGKRPLAARPYYARLTQALITALTAPMAEGRLYEVDMRLRPSGNQGPVATSWASFREYQQNEAWVWEHLALTRARAITQTGAGLGEEIEAFRVDLLNQPQDREKVLREVAEMRARLFGAKSPDGSLDAKNGPGRIQDIELAAQAGALLAGAPVREVSEGLAAAARAGWLEPGDAEALRQSYDRLWAVRMAARLLSGTTPDTERIGEGGAAFLCRSIGADDLEALQTTLLADYEETARRIDAALEGDGDENRG